MTLESFPRATRAVIDWANPVIKAVLNIRNAAYDGEEVAVAHTFLETSNLRPWSGTDFTGSIGINRKDNKRSFELNGILVSR
jgi:hypothetical protein